MMRVTVQDENNRNWTEIGFAQLKFGEAPWQTLAFPDMEGKGRVVRFMFTNTREQALQLGEIIFKDLAVTA